MSFRQHTKFLLLLSSALSMALVVIIALNAQRSMREMSHNNSELFSAYKISGLMKGYRGTFTALENKRKGYIITGEAKFLEASKEKETELKTLLKSMEHFFRDTPEEENFNKLKDLTYQHIMNRIVLGPGAELSGFQANTNDEEATLNTASEITQLLDQIDVSLDQMTTVLINNSVTYVSETKIWSIAEVSLTTLLTLIAVIIVFRDINTRTRLELELRQAKLKSDENAQIKEQFTANMSHEIRTPLNAIIGFASLLEKSNLQGAQKEYLDAIQVSSHNLLNIVNDVLDFSKLEAGQISIEKISFTLSQLLDHIKRIFELKAAEKNITFQLVREPGIPEHLFGDPNRLSQILINLVNNAVKFTEQGEVTLRCELKNIEHEVAGLVFRIKDTGIGIPDDKIAGIFERFKQASSDTTRKYGGTGLGLSIVRDLVERQNGTVQVKSKLGQGSEFIVQLSFPIALEEKIIVTEPLPDKNRFLPNHFKILLAEDNVLNQKLAKTYLETFGLTVDLATNGAEAVQLCKSQTYDLILMDIHMPVMDGYQATEHIRRDLLQETPIVALTASSLPAEKEKCLKIGMSDYLSKPFKEKELHDILQKWLPKNSRAANLDLKNFYSLTMGNKKFMKEMIELFLKNNPSDLAHLKSALSVPDFETLRQTAHRMKTSVGFMGVTDLLEPLNQIELLSEQNKGIDRISPLILQIDQTCTLAQEELKKELIKINAA